MPFVNATVNLDLTQDQQSALTLAIHAVIKSALGKPDGYIAVNLNISKNLIFAKKNLPCAVIQVQAVGGGGQAAAASGITKALAEYGVEADRVFVNFQSFSGKDWAMGGSLFG